MKDAQMSRVLALRTVMPRKPESTFPKGPRVRIRLPPPGSLQPLGPLGICGLIDARRYSGLCNHGEAGDVRWRRLRWGASVTGGARLAHSRLSGQAKLSSLPSGSVIWKK